MVNDIYIELREFLDRLPSGFPTTPDGLEIRLLKKLFTPDEAALTVSLTDEPETVATLSLRLQMDKESLASQLEMMARKGLIFRIMRDGLPLYLAYQFMIGIYEFQLKAIDREFSELFDAYLPYMGMSMARTKTKQMRIIPVESALETVGGVETYDRIREVISQQELITVAQCICKKEHELLGSPCDKPQEVCFGFGDFARFYIDNEFSRQISKEEAFSILDDAEEAGLVLMPTNSKEISAICCCCTCCCAALKYAKLAYKPSRFVLSHYQARIDSTLCSACEECLSRCPMEAIEIADDVAKIIERRCIGCGLCVPNCPTGASQMVLKPDMPVPLDSYDDVIRQIKHERSLG
jgi:H+/Na+-translocating ferredoxin:NAD+ oxidoreductase subunit B